MTDTPKRRTIASSRKPVAAQSTIAPKRIMTVTEGRGIAIEIGICIFDLNSCEATLCQLADSQTLTRTLQKIDLNEPQKILMPVYATDTDNPMTSKLSKLTELQFPHISIITLARKYFDDEQGKRYIQEYGLQEDVAGLLFGIATKYYCLAAISGAFRHIFETEGYRFAPHTIKFTYQGAEDTMMIDTITAKNLELVANTNSNTTRNTLLHVLDRTLTPMGRRLLRMNILQPPCSLEIIKDRLDVVQELSKSEETIFNLQTCLKHMIDMDHTIAYIVKLPNTTKKSSLVIQQAEIKTNQVIGLKQTIKAIRSIAACLPESSHCLLLNTIHKILSSQVFDELEKVIQTTVNEEVCVQKSSLGIRNQRCYAIKAGVNGLLDVARQTYKETTEDIYELVEQYNRDYRLQMKLQFSAAHGFYITTNPLAAEKGLPPLFINAVKKKKSIQCTTIELLQKNFRINESLTEVYLMSDKIVTELLQIFRDNINILYKASEAIALLDMLISLAACNISSDYVRPEFSDTLAIKSGRHPILSQILSFPLVPNDSFASLSSSFQFITGPNMSGKSTYLRQVALLTIMAHTGSFVPAEYACFRLTDQLLSRLANDNTFSDIGTSSFMSEMRETAYLLQHVTDTSLVIIDELGRGTSPSDALGITAAVCEDLIHTRAFCFFATHLHELTRTLDIYPNVVNLQFKVHVTRTQGNDITVDYQYKIEDGNLQTESNYGLRTAQVLGFPKQVLACAYKIVTELKGNGYRLSPEYEKDKRKVSRERKLLWFADKVLQLGQVEIPNDQLHEQFYQLQNNILQEEQD